MMYLTTKDKIESLGKKATAIMKDDRIISGQVAAFNVDQNSIGLKDITIKEASKQVDQQFCAGILFQKDIKTLEVSPNRTYDFIKRMEKENTGHVKPHSASFRVNSEYVKKEPAKMANMFSVKSEEVVEDKNISLVNWQPDPEHPDEPYEEKEGDGWTVQQMYSANEKLGVHSSFTNIDMYSTTKPEGDEHAICRAEKLAKEIEASAESKKNAMMENMDEERDINESVVEEKKPARPPKRQSEHKKRDLKQTRPKDGENWRDRREPISTPKSDNSKSARRPKEFPGKPTAEKRVPEVQPTTAENQQDKDPKFKFNAKAEEFVFHQVSVPQQQNVSAPPIYAAPVMYPPMSFAYGQQIPFVYGQQMMGGYNPAMIPQAQIQGYNPAMTNYPAIPLVQPHGFVPQAMHGFVPQAMHGFVPQMPPNYGWGWGSYAPNQNNPQ